MSPIFRFHWTNLFETKKKKRLMEDYYKSLTNTKLDDWTTLESILFSTEFIDRYKQLDLQYLIDFCESYALKLKQMVTQSSLRIPKIPVTVLENEYWTLSPPPTFLTIWCLPIPTQFPIYVFINNHFSYVESEIDVENLVFTSTHILSPFEFIIYDSENVFVAEISELDDLPRNSLEESLVLYSNYLTKKVLALQGELKLRFELSGEIEKMAKEEMATVQYLSQEMLDDMSYVKDFIAK